MSRAIPALAALALLGTVTACGSSSPKAASPPASAVAATTAAAAPTTAAAPATTAAAAEPTSDAPAADAGTSPAAVDSSAPTAAGGAFDPCAALTSTEIKTALGGTVTMGVAKTDDTNGPVCEWTLSGTAVGGGTLQVYDKMDDATVFKLSKEGLVGADAAVSVTGVGTDAYFAHAITDKLTVLKGDMTFAVEAAGDDDNEDQAKVMAAIVSLGKLVAAK